MAEKNKIVGGGFVLVPPGNLELFDPDTVGLKKGSRELHDRINSGLDFSIKKSPSVVHESSLQLCDAQNWLEHLDDDLPLNIFKNTAPSTATLLGSVKIIGDDAPGDIRHIVMKLPPTFHYVEGQSISIIPPGLDPVTQRPHKPRLYSIASTRYGDSLDGTTVSLCVRRSLFYDPVTGMEDSNKKGVCSNFLCDAPPGAIVTVAGPVGKTMLLPKDPTKDVIMVATGTGIAPFRAFLHRLFVEHTVARHMFTGLAWLILGVPTTSGLLYDTEFSSMQNQNALSGSLKIDYAISREMQNAKGGKLYVQDVIAQNSEEIFRRLDNGASIFFCGLKGMMPPILETMEQVANDRGVNWKEMLSRLKDNHQWHVEVY
eukprot:CAMPEP_0172427784 /NCGR_PEP_ID=MMETSP1064-20121228/43561_1 /TAXON_ID=202472 /ORGANISM="Aulacoseira subarctica , Strain CCAP 1002/5" /LENGTH=371 /DNA_ID=CAMNT_0013172199 /DNA_START=198 /DNA_END=1313 /DNA_ORIENTATION=+